MKIAIPVDGKSKDDPVASVFGRTGHFLIYDQDQASYTLLENVARQRPGGAGVQAAQFLVDQGVQVVIAPQCGANAFRVLKGAEIEVFSSVEGSVEANLSAYLENKLRILPGNGL